MMNSMEIITKSAEETVKLAERLGRTLKAGDVIACKGGLGAGKTTFTRGLCAGLGIEARVSSPTFTLVNEYRGEKLTLYHFDMYRITNAGDLETTGFYDYLSDNNGVMIIEWSENISDVIAGLENVITITFANTINEDERIIIIEADSLRFGEKYDFTRN